MTEIRNLAIVGLAGLLVWFGSAVIRLEQYHYASMTGVCGYAADELAHIRKETCLNRRHHLRTSPVWDLAYGLGL